MEWIASVEAAKLWWALGVILTVHAFLILVGLFVVADAIMRRLGVVGEALEVLLESRGPKATSLEDIFDLAGDQVGTQLIVIRMRAGYVGEVRRTEETLASSGPLDVEKPDQILWDIEAKLRARNATSPRSSVD